MMRQWNRVAQATGKATDQAQTPTPSLTRRLTRRRGGKSTWGMKAGMLAMAMVAATAAISVAQGGQALAQTPAATRTTLEIASRPAQAAGASGRPSTETVLTAHVTDADGTPIEAGTVSFESGSGSLGAGSLGAGSLGSGSLGAGSLGAALLGAGGEATITVTSVPASTAAGTPAVRAVYHPPAVASGEAAVSASSASPASLVVADATGVPDFTVTANPSTVTATQGLSATSGVTITPMNGFSEQVTLSCSNLPAQATCTFSPVIASTAAGAFTSTLQVQTQGAAGVTSLVAPGAGTPMTLAWLLPGVLALAGFAAARRNGLADGTAAGRTAMVLLPALLLLGGGLGLAGCSARYGYNHHPPSVSTGTLVGTYQITIAASGNNGSAVTEHDITLTLQVQ